MVVEEKNSDVQMADYSLCHGLAGICELLIYAHEIFTNDQNRYKSLATDVGIYGVKKYASPGLPWPCGVHTGETPGLMLGLAGIGYFYLRLTNSSKIPSVTIITPQ